MAFSHTSLPRPGGTALPLSQIKTHIDLRSEKATSELQRYALQGFHACVDMGSKFDPAASIYANAYNIAVYGQNSDLAVYNMIVSANQMVDALKKGSGLASIASAGGSAAVTGAGGAVALPSAPPPRTNLASASNPYSGTIGAPVPPPSAGAGLSIMGKLKQTLGPQAPIVLAGGGALLLMVLLLPKKKRK
jgi:hypothetical protein